MARKAKRSKKQIAAAKRNLRKARHARRRHNPLVVVKAKLLRKSPRKKARKSPRKSSHRKAPRKKARKIARRSSARKVTHRKSPKRVRAARKAARTRARNKAYRSQSYTPPSHQLAAERPRRRRAKGRRRNPIAAEVAAAPRKRRKAKKRKGGGRATGTRKYKPFKKAGYSARRRTRKGTKKQRANAARRGWDRRRGRKIRRNPIASRRRHRASSRRRNPIAISRRSNPITGAAEFFSGVFGVGFGFFLASVADRFATNHNYIAATGAGGLMDAPVAGSIYNSEAILVPMWKKANAADMFPTRLAWAAGSVILPLTIAAFIKTHPAAKSFFQLAGFGAIGRTAGKLIEDGVASMGSSNALVQKLFAPELAATAKKAVATLPAAPAATFAGALPHGLRHVGSAIQDHAGNDYVQVGNQFVPAPPPPPTLNAAPPIVTMAAPPAAPYENTTPPASPAFSPVNLPFNPYAANPDGLH